LNALPKSGIIVRDNKQGDEILKKQTWRRSDQVRNSVATIERMNRNHLELPEVLIEHLQNLINNSESDYTALFYQLVSEKCPELLKHWAKEKESRE
jgi:hypothetical protein